MSNRIPVMDDWLSAYWSQPNNIRDAVMNDSHVFLTATQVGELAEYSRSLPSGVYPGKCWKLLDKGRALLLWYGDEVDGRCTVMHREIQVIDSLCELLA